MTRISGPIGPWTRFFGRTAAIAGASTLAGIAHPIAGFVTALAGILWLASRYDNHTGSLLLATIVLLSAVAILVALLIVTLAIVSR